LLNFIEGEKNSQEGGGKKTKKSKQKHKKDLEKVIEDASNPITLVDKVLEKDSKSTMTSDSSLDEKSGITKVEKALPKAPVSVKGQTSTLDFQDGEVAEDKTNTKKKKRKKQGEKEKSVETNLTTKAFLDEPSISISVTTRKNAVPSTEQNSSGRQPDNVKSKPKDERKRNKSPQERKAKIDPKKMTSSKTASIVDDKVAQTPLKTSPVSKQPSMKKGKATVKVENSLTNHKTVPHADANLARQTKDKSLNKRLQADQVTNQRNQNAIETSQKQNNRKKNTKPTQKSPINAQDKIIVNGQDHISLNTSAAPNTQSRDKSIAKEVPNSSKGKEPRNSSNSSNANQEKSNTKSTSEQEKLTENG